jgi:hypothetical protein
MKKNSILARLSDCNPESPRKNTSFGREKTEEGIEQDRVVAQKKQGRRPGEV